MSGLYSIVNSYQLCVCDFVFIFRSLFMSEAVMIILSFRVKVFWFSFKSLILYFLLFFSVSGLQLII